MFTFAFFFSHFFTYFRKKMIDKDLMIDKNSGYDSGRYIMDKYLIIILLFLLLPIDYGSMKTSIPQKNI